METVAQNTTVRIRRGIKMVKEYAACCDQMVKVREWGCIEGFNAYFTSIREEPFPNGRIIFGEMIPIRIGKCPWCGADIQRVGLDFE